MTVTVEPIEVTAQPVVLTAAATVEPLTINVGDSDPVVVDVSPITAAVQSVPVAVTLTMSGGQGIPGPPGDGTVVLGESPTGAQDGVNVAFTTAVAYRAISTAVYLNGLRETHYTESGPAEITFGTAPLTGDTIAVDYVIE